MNRFKNTLCSTGYNVSYGIFSVYYKMKDMIAKLKTDDNKPEHIKISHLYHRPTSSLRKDHCYDTKDLIWDIDYAKEENINDKIWLLVEEHLRRKKDRLQTGDTIEVHYTVPFRDVSQNRFEKSYIVPYSYPAKIQFPPYDLETIRKYHHSCIYRPGILSADVGERDVTNEVERWIGPLDNFYSDRDLCEGMYVTRNLVVGEAPNPLIIINKEGDELTFNKRDLLDIES